MLDRFPDTPSSELPSFDAVGNLPAGDYAPNRIDFEERFVNMGDRNRRSLIYEGWNHHRAALLRAGLHQNAKQLLNGSFTTAKESPGDIDIAVEVPMDTSMEEQIDSHRILELLRGSLVKAEYMCDAYPILSYPEDHEYHEAATVEAIRYWTKWFGTDRTGNSKGRVWARTGGLS